MKKYVMKLAGCILVALTILLVVLKIVDMHSDGILVRDNNYVISPQNTVTYRMDVYGGVGWPGTPVQLTRTADGANQVYGIRYIGDDKYSIIYGDQGMCVAVASDKTSVVIQGYDESNDYNLWNITRIGNTQGYLFTNVATGTSICYERSQETGVNMLVVREYDESNETFGFTLAR